MASDATASDVVPQHFSIVALETIFTGLPPITVPAPHTFTLTTYERSTAAEVGPRLRDAAADIAIITTVPVRGDALDPANTPKLKLISAIASGTDTIDLAACKKRGIRVLNSPGCNIDAVAEHAVSLYFACRRRIVPSMTALQRGDWPKKGTLMHTAMTGGNAAVRRCATETVALVGYGAVGKRVAELLRALGMHVLVTARKGATGSLPNGRVAFEDAIRKATLVVLCCPRTHETLNLLSTPELNVMQPDCLVVNVSRGGIVNEQALLEALQTSKIGGAGVDVFGVEPAGPETSPLLTSEVASSDLNLVVTPHTAWVAAQTTANNHQVLVENINGFVSGSVNPDRIRA
ncbi:glycerate dehydrogenase [Ophiostoma piceae UAMH 11346]|uniref:Glycerate dehydrogenase n=1 Tax=Ophiostoma piceae (strain UAMH 11346) TaxID=1262450 RepID=S3D7E8_OPHP1|nr:glycerate dehydrogenase [Ophiostoma piceae UAMH 11346]